MSGNKEPQNTEAFKCNHLDCRRGYLEGIEEEIGAGGPLEAELFRAVAGGAAGVQRPRGDDDDDDRHEEVVESWNCLRNPETRQMVSDFQRNIFQLLASTTARVANGRGAGGDLEGAFGGVQDEVGGDAGVDVQGELEVCRRFATQLYLNGGEGGKKFMEGAAAAGNPLTMEGLMKELDSNGMEFNPFRLVEVIGDRLGYMGRLLEMLSAEKNRLQERANQVEERMARERGRQLPVLEHEIPQGPAEGAGEADPNDGALTAEEFFEEDDEIDFEPDSSDEQ